jgi:uncharacterized protein (DUF2237 family)
LNPFLPRFALFFLLLSAHPGLSSAHSVYEAKAPACDPGNDPANPPACLGISKTSKPEERSEHRNAFGKPLALCSKSPMAGFYRNGFCETGPEDGGLHTVCAKVTKRFLEFTRSKGNDLSTPHPEYGFPGLQPGDRWCLCAARWEEAKEAGKAPEVILEATHEATLKIVPKSRLRE